MKKEFKEAVLAQEGCAVILAGSSSDKNHIDDIITALSKYEIPVEARIASAHKQPEKVLKLIEEYDALNGSLVYICIAGKTDALSGTVSFHSTRPVISCPPDKPNYSSTNNLTTSSNAYIENPKNLARFIAQMYAHANPMYKKKLEEEKIESLEKADDTLWDH